MKTRPFVVLMLAVAAPSLTGCGEDDIKGEDDIGAQNDRIAGEVFQELDNAAFETKFDAPRDVACARPKPGRFECIAYVQVADDVALTAVYRVVACEFGWRAEAVDAHENLTVPARLQYEREIDTACPWASSGSFLQLDAD